jgi:hypothetical protein
MKVILSGSIESRRYDRNEPDNEDALVIMTKGDLLDVVGSALANGENRTIQSTADVALFRSRARIFLRGYRL